MSEVKVAQSCPTLCNHMDYTVHGILQARILEWAAIPFSRGSSQPRNRTGVSCLAGGFLTNWAMREARNVSVSIASLAEEYRRVTLHFRINGHSADDVTFSLIKNTPGTIIETEAVLTPPSHSHSSHPSYLPNRKVVLEEKLRNILAWMDVIPFMVWKR